MGYIELKGLDFMKMRNWIKPAKDKQSNDPIFSFISAWIGFNYYYSTFANEHENEFKSWANKKFCGNLRDKSQWSFLVSHDSFKAFFSKASAMFPPPINDILNLFIFPPKIIDIKITVLYN